MKIIKDNKDGTFLVELPKKEYAGYCYNTIQVAHDYIRFKGKYFPKKSNGFTDLENGFEVDNTIGIKAMIDVVLPFLNKHKYCQPEHLADGIHKKDDEFWNSEHNKQENLTGPRWKKGDLYPAYSYYNQVIEYYDNEKNQIMVAICESGQKTFNHVTKSFFDKYIKDNLKH